jgi:hypothetical protein
MYLATKYRPQCSTTESCVSLLPVIDSAYCVKLTVGFAFIAVGSDGKNSFPRS